MKKTVVKNEGIYDTVEIEFENDDERKEYYLKRNDLFDLLKSIRENAKDVLKEYIGKILIPKEGLPENGVHYTYIPFMKPHLFKKIGELPSNAEVAIQVLKQLDSVEGCIPARQVEKSIVEALHLGALFERMRVMPFEKVSLIGRKVRDGGEKGHNWRHSKWGEYKKALINYLEKKPHWSLTQCRKQVADDFNVSIKTITRHTKDINRKLSPKK